MVYGKKSTKGARKKKTVLCGIAHIYATFNNTIITISDLQGNVIGWSSAGVAGFKGTRKSTPYAAQMAAEKVAEFVKDSGLKSLEVHTNGPGSGRESALRTLRSFFLVTAIRDVTPMPFNGCRLRKKRYP
jgi:small subunit ribosomal protein S11